MEDLIFETGAIATITVNRPKALNALLGLKFRLVGGYSSSAEVLLAMERGEVQGEGQQSHGQRGNLDVDAADGERVGVRGDRLPRPLDRDGLEAMDRAMEIHRRAGSKTQSGAIAKSGRTSGLQCTG